MMSVCRGSDSDYTAARAAQEASVGKQRASVRAQKTSAVAQDPLFFVTAAHNPAAEVPPEKIREIVDDGAKLAPASLLL